MDKMTLAHDWYMKNCSGGKSHVSLEVEWAWQYADEMQKQFKKRKEIQPDVDASSSGGWQPDWRKTSKNMKYFAVDGDGRGWFFSREPHIEGDGCWYCGDDCTQSYNHGYTGDWRDSLHKRPENK